MASVAKHCNNRRIMQSLSLCTRLALPRASTRLVRAASTAKNSNTNGGTHERPLVSWLSYQDASKSRCLCDTQPSTAGMSSALPPHARTAPSNTTLSAASSKQPLDARAYSQACASSSSGAPLDAIVVLAGGLTDDGGVPSWVERRLDAAHDLYMHLAQEGHAVPILCLGGGTPHKPPILTGPGGYVIHESTSCTRYLNQRGVPLQHMLKEVSSYDTVGNAYFSLTIHALPAAWRHLAFITSDFHMPRTRDLFEAAYGLAGRDLLGRPDHYSMLWLGVTDEGLFTPDVLEARLLKEAASQAAWRKTAAGLRSMRELHAWLHATHMCYSVERQAEWGRPTDLDPKLLASY